MKVSEIVSAGIKPLFPKDIRLVEVEYCKKSDGMHLVVYIDKDNGVTIDDCVTINNLIADKLDELNPTNDSPYILDVSSYGLDKPLKYDFQFKKYKNKLVNVKLYHKIGKLKEFVATFLDKDETAYYFQYENENITIPIVDTAYITPYIEF